MSEDKFKFRLDRSVFFLNFRIVISVIVFMAVSSIMLLNTTYLNNFITQRTKKFTQDLTFQHATSIQKEVSTRMLNIQMIADSMVQTGNISHKGQLKALLKKQ
jgi:hypothetical protein